MGIVRMIKNKDHPFVMISKSLIQDKDLSLKARGLMAFLLSKPDDWEIYITQLASSLKEHRETITKVMNELIEAGYCNRKKHFRTGGQPRIRGKYSGYDYDVFESKHLNRVAKTDTVTRENRVAKTDTTNKVYKGPETLLKRLCPKCKKEREDLKIPFECEECGWIFYE